MKSDMDLRPGGTYHYCLKTADGGVMWGKFVYREIVPPERLVWVNSFSDEARNVTHYPMMPTWPLELLTTVTLEDVDGGTKLAIRWSPFETATDEERATFNAGHESMNKGWTGTLDQLAAYLAHA